MDRLGHEDSPAYWPRFSTSTLFVQRCCRTNYGDSPFYILRYTQWIWKLLLREWPTPGNQQIKIPRCLLHTIVLSERCTLPRAIRV